MPCLLPPSDAASPHGPSASYRIPDAVYHVTSRGDGRMYLRAAAEETLYALILTFGRGAQGIQPPYFTNWR